MPQPRRHQSDLDGIPEGWQLVPKRMDVGMIGAWYRYKNGHRFQGEPPATDTSDVGAWAALLAAAPEPPASPLPSGTVGEPVGVKTAKQRDKASTDELKRLVGAFPPTPVVDAARVGETVQVKQLGGAPEDLRNVLCGVVELLGIDAASQITSYALKHRGINAFDGSSASPPSEPAPQVVGDDLKKASWALYYAVQDIDLGRSVHNSRKPDQPIDGPLWKTLMKAASELHGTLSPTPPTLSTDAVGKEG